VGGGARVEWGMGGVGWGPQILSFNHRIKLTLNCSEHSVQRALKGGVYVAQLDLSL
jgi:hypothetical protein